MSRRRYISTNTSTDKAFNTLGRQYGDFAAMLYLLMIPHAEDDGTLTGEPEELLAKVVPMRRDKDVPDIVAALEAMSGLGLIAWDREKERVSFPSANFYKYQSYIPDNKRGTAKGEAPEAPSPQNAEEQRETAQNPASPSPSPSLSPSPSGEKDANANALSAAAPPAKAKKVSSERSEQIGQEAVREYQERYRRAYGTYAEFLQGDAPALKDARMKLGARFVLALDRFFGCANERVKARRHAVKMFCGEINVWLDDAAVSVSFPPPLAGARASPPSRRNGAYQPTGTLDEQKAAILAQLRE